ncbi:MAG TPA: class I SAM-dependent methyltransferase [Thermoanaerobaculaceae bacterium]|nr:class I SAM-dependent methyltransferase [Thermoanaerobaculaceae bacterium]
MTAITKCRICGSTDLAEVVNLGSMALTGIFPRPGVHVDEAPLQLLRCATGCGLVQIAETYDLSKMYGATYGYRSGLNRSMVAHLSSLVADIMDRVDLAAGDVVVDIGANDGTTLGFYPDRVRRIGVDPSGAKFKEFYKSGVELIPDFFSAAKLKAVLGDKKAKAVTSFAMFYDLEDPLAFMKEVAEILCDDGIWVMEQSYLPAMLRANAFDTICHEHIEYYALAQIEWMAERAGLAVIAVDETSTNGGSFVVTLSRRDSASHVGAFWTTFFSPGVQRLRDQETRSALRDPMAYRAFTLRSTAAVMVLEEFLREAKKAGKTCCGLGASTKGNVVLQSIHGIRDLIATIGDVNPDKWGCVTPGTHIPIVSEDDVLADDPDYLIVLPWHFRNNFVENPKFKGRRLVFPLPQLEIVQL